MNKPSKKNKVTKKEIMELFNKIEKENLHYNDKFSFKFENNETQTWIILDSNSLFINSNLQ